MSKTIEFYTVGPKEEAYVIEDDMFPITFLKDGKECGATNAQEMQDVRGGVLKHTLTVKPPKFGLKAEINKRAQEPDLALGMKFNPTLLPMARILTVIEQWATLDMATCKEASPSLVMQPVNEEAIEEWSIPVGEYLDAKINIHLQPNVSTDKDFFLKFGSRQPPSGTIVDSSPSA